MRRVLLDECVPVSLGRALEGVDMRTTEAMGWKGIKNGELVTAAEREFDVLLTADKNLRYQQNLAGRRIAIVELPFNSWPRLRERIEHIRHAVVSVPLGGYVALAFD